MEIEAESQPYLHSVNTSSVKPTSIYSYLNCSRKKLADMYLPSGLFLSKCIFHVSKSHSSNPSHSLLHSKTYLSFYYELKMAQTTLQTIMDSLGTHIITHCTSPPLQPHAQTTLCFFPCTLLKKRKSQLHVHHSIRKTITVYPVAPEIVQIAKTSQQDV